MSSNVPKTLGVAGSRWAVAAVALCLVGGAAAAFDPDRAERAWTHSQVAYCRMGSDLNSGYPAQVVDWNCSYCLSPFGVGFEFLTDLSNGSTQAYVGYTPATAECAVSFRGTEVGLTDIQDVITDINILRVSPDEYNRSDVEVHHGFYSAYRRVAPQLIAELGAAVNSGLCNKVLVTGHSLGGALATLAAVDIALEFPQLQQEIDVVTFGQPRVGNRPFAFLVEELFPDRVIRVVRFQDPVPRTPTPPLTTFFGVAISNILSRMASLVTVLPLEPDNFHHVGTEAWYPDPPGVVGALILCRFNETVGFRYLDCSDQVLIRDTLGSVSHHLIATYLWSNNTGTCDAVNFTVSTPAPSVMPVIEVQPRRPMLRINIPGDCSLITPDDSTDICAEAESRVSAALSFLFGGGNAVEDCVLGCGSIMVMLTFAPETSPAAVEAARAAFDATPLTVNISTGTVVSNGTAVSLPPTPPTPAPTLAPTPPGEATQGSGSDSGNDDGLIAGLVVAAVVLLAAGGFVLHQRRSREAGPSEVAGAGAPGVVVAGAGRGYEADLLRSGSVHAAGDGFAQSTSV